MDKFLYGVSSSAFQIEGDDGTQGRGKSVWDNYCERKNTIYNNENAKISADHYGRYQEDVDLMAELGVNAYRFSTSWSRIFPEGVGNVNEKGADFYDRLIDALLERGIEPLLTMYHWDLPQYLSDRGGLQNSDFSKWFTEYAEFIAKRYGDRVTKYCTFNEPINAVHSSYYAGVFAPGYRLNEEQFLWCLHHLHLAHARATEVLHREVKNSVSGIAMSTFEEYPAILTEKCIDVARHKFFERKQTSETIDLYMDPLYLGTYPNRILEAFPDFAEKSHQGRKELKKISVDYIGYNTYSGCPILENGEEARRPSGVPASLLGSILDPNGLYWGAKFLSERYKMPLYVLENGAACADWVSEDGRVHDAGRVDFLKQNLKVLGKLQSEIDVRGYFIWSFMDNFEWLKGYSCRFGLVHIDYDTLKRTPKDSYYFYRNYIEESRKK